MYVYIYIAFDEPPFYRITSRLNHCRGRIEIVFDDYPENVIPFRFYPNFCRKSQDPSSAFPCSNYAVCRAFDPFCRKTERSRAFGKAVLDMVTRPIDVRVIISSRPRKSRKRNLSASVEMRTRIAVITCKKKQRKNM